MSTENLQVHIYGAGVEAAVLTAKTRNTENMNTQFLLCRVAVIWCTISVQNVDTAPRNSLHCCCTGHFYFLFALFLLLLLQHCCSTTGALLVGNHSLQVLPEQGKFLSGSGQLQLYYSSLLGYITVQQYGGKIPVKRTKSLPTLHHLNINSSKSPSVLRLTTVGGSTPSSVCTDESVVEIMSSATGYVLMA